MKRTTLKRGLYLNKYFKDATEVYFTNLVIPENLLKDAKMISYAKNKHKAYLVKDRNIITIYVSEENVEIFANKDCSKMFKDCYYLSKIIFENFNVSEVENMSAMFNSCGHNAQEFKIIGLDNWDTYNVTNMESMFLSSGNASKIWNIGDISNWNVSNVADMSFMFLGTAYSCEDRDIGNMTKWSSNKDIKTRCMFNTTHDEFSIIKK